MAPLSIVALYGAVGAASAALALKRHQPLGQALLMLPLWPFLLPALRGPSARSNPEGEVAAQLAKLEQALDSAWAQVSAMGAGRPAERERIGRFVSHLRAQVARLDEMDRALQGAAERLRQPLEQLRARTAAEVGEGLVLLEELCTQLTLLRFTGGPGGEAARHEKDHVEALLARIGALAEVSGAA